MMLDRKTYLAGDIVANAGQPVDALLLVMRGTVKVEPRGRKRGFLLGPGVPLGLYDVMSGRQNPVFASKVTALDQVEVALLDRKAFEAEFRRLPDHVRAIFNSVFVISLAAVEAYEGRTETQIETLKGLAEEIEKLVENA